MTTTATAPHSGYPRWQQSGEREVLGPLFTTWKAHSEWTPDPHRAMAPLIAGLLITAATRTLP